MLDTIIQRLDNAIQILVGQQPEHRQAPSCHGPPRQALGQVLRRMRVMTDVQQQVQAFALPIELAAVEAPDEETTEDYKTSLPDSPSV